MSAKPEACPACFAKFQWQKQKCPDCGLSALEEALNSPTGAILQRAGELIFEAKELGITHLKSELSATEFAAMRLLRQEQITYSNDLMSKS